MAAGRDVFSGVKMEQVLNLIDGSFRPPLKGEYLTTISPASAKAIGKIPQSTSEDVDEAVMAAKKAFPLWRDKSIHERGECLKRLSKLIEENIEAFSVLESEDNGKPVHVARSIDIPRSIQNLSFFAEAICQWPSESHHGSQGLNYTLRQPRGVVACISPWNLPLYLFTWKIAPALAAGNTVVAKPSEVTPLTAYYLAKLVQKAGFPDGVLNIIHGTGGVAGEALVCHKDVKTITFTGGTATGRRIAQLAAPMFKKYSLELGGKNANIIFADAPFEKMIETTLRSSFANQGQICLCGSRILVEESLYERFKEAFIKRVKGLKVGDPKDPRTDQGAIVSREHYEKVLFAIEKAKKEGGRILCGGGAAPQKGALKDGYFIEPTVIEGLDENSCTFKEEIFGPVVTLNTFSSDKEALKLANSSEYGLSCSIFTENLTRAHMLASCVNVGIVWINGWLLRDLRTPFGGVGISGVGREGGFEALRFFTEPKNVCIGI